MSFKNDLVYIHHMYDELQHIAKHSKDLPWELFKNDDTLKRAFIRSYEILGEASKNISTEFREKNPQIPWKSLAGLGDKLIHHYMAVDYELIWDITQNKVPSLLNELTLVLNSKMN